MKLTKVHITEFQSIQDSNEFEIDDVTCLIGKNEAGKTALLKALYRLNPINEEDGDFDVTDDYPRRTVTDYEDEVEAERRKPAQVVQATYAFESEDITAVKKAFGPECLGGKAPFLTLSKGYSNKRTFGGFTVDDKSALKHIIENANLPRQLADRLLKMETAQEMVEALDTVDPAEESQEPVSILQSISEHGVAYVVYNEILRHRVPKFLYFDEYYQLKGQDNLDALLSRVESNTLEDSDYPLLGLIELARIDLNQLTNPRRTETLIARLEAAGNSLTQRVLPYWSQNQHLRMQFDIRQAQQEDPPNMNTGMNIWGRVQDTKHSVSTSLGTRSRGFVWFFSFLSLVFAAPKKA